MELSNGGVGKHDRGVQCHDRRIVPPCDVTGKDPGDSCWIQRQLFNPLEVVSHSYRAADEGNIQSRVTPATVGGGGQIFFDDGLIRATKGGLCRKECFDARSRADRLVVDS